MKEALLLVMVPLALAGEVTVRLFAMNPPRQINVNGRTVAGVARFCCTETIALPGQPAFQVQGEISIRPRKQGLEILLKQPLEEYVTNVLAGESNTFTENEALKAMAVTARTYAVRNRGRHLAEGYDFCDTTHCQDLRLAARTRRLAEIVEATEGEILWWDGTSAHVFYHKHCGGTTEAAHELWPEVRAPYLRQQEDTYCLASGRLVWRAELGESDLAVVSRTPSGRVRQLRVNGSIRPVEWFLRAGGQLQSSRFEIFRRPAGAAVEGFGAGHGVGLCQMGTAERAKQGHTHRQILSFYFPGTAVGVTAQGLSWARLGGARVELWSTRPEEDGPMVELAERGLREAERRSGLVVDGLVRVRVYPTLAAYRDATGEPGWVAGSTSGGVIRLQPAAQLRSRGVLELALLHEFLHVLIEARARPGLPAWFLEGLALYLENPGARPSTIRLTERNLTEPPSEAAMRRAYEAARSRVGALARQHGQARLISWLERGLPAEITATSASQRVSTNR